MTSNFDAVAPTFERYRGLPRGVPEAIRSAILQATRKQPPARVLDLGAGTGRIGKAFVAADDFYVGVDASLGMLQEFLLTTRTLVWRRLVWRRRTDNGCRFVTALSMS